MSRGLWVSGAGASGGLGAHIPCLRARWSAGLASCRCTPGGSRCGLRCVLPATHLRGLDGVLAPGFGPAPSLCLSLSILLFEIGENKQAHKKVPRCFVLNLFSLIFTPQASREEVSELCGSGAAVCAVRLLGFRQGRGQLLAFRAVFLAESLELLCFLDVNALLLSVLQVSSAAECPLTLRCI